MIKTSEIVGKKFGMLTILGSVNEHPGNGKHIHLDCVCDCGKKTFPRKVDVLRGKIISCGCYAKIKTKIRNTTHGYYGTRLYRIWNGIMARTVRKSKSASSKRYWERGICVCEEWKDFIKFKDWAMENGYKESLSIDRKNNDGDYCPKNCRWVTAKEQAINTSKNKKIKYNGEELCLSEIAEKYGINKNTFWKRINHGYSVEEAVYTGKYSTRYTRHR